MHGHTQRVAAMRFSPDGHTLYTGSWDGEVRQWSLDRLTTPAATLVAEVAEAWHVDLDEAMATPVLHPR